MLQSTAGALPCQGSLDPVAGDDPRRDRNCWQGAQRQAESMSRCIMHRLGLGNKRSLEAHGTSSTRPVAHRNVTPRPPASIQDDVAQPRREAEERKKRDLSAHRRRQLQRSRNSAELGGARSLFAEHGPHMSFCKGGLSARVVTVRSKEYPQPGGT